jgi:hypothetical protein
LRGLAWILVALVALVALAGGAVLSGGLIGVTAG